MQNTIKIRIKTLSNLLIGGAPLPFEIGGIDQQTVLDQEGFPYIPGSSLKGVLRTAAREDNTITMGAEITRLFTAYLESAQAANAQRIRELVDEPEARKRIAGQYAEAKEKLSPEYLFGIEGFNNTPKLLFSDLLLCEQYRDKESCFSIDMKNSIDASGDTPASNPRTYRTARSGLVFAGDIRLYKMECWDDKAIELCKKYIVSTLLKFNEGIYRLGNSKSRGYGKVEAAIIEESEAMPHEKLSN
jgi:CRISPR-associated protein Csm3